jgi:ELWxxDGT repeat protein
MWFPSLFSPWRSPACSGSGGHFRYGKSRPARRKPASRRPTVELLEDRCLLASGLSAALVADIVPGIYGSNPGGLYSNASGFVVMNNTLYFAADDGVHGSELFKSDGTAAGTVLVKDINPGSASSSLSNMTPVGGTLYFAADDGVHGYELWKSDGTAAGTVMVKDINPGSANSLPESLTNVNGTLFFSAYDGIHGRELWKSDGTAAGTVIVADINPRSDSSVPLRLTNVNGTLFFAANDGKHGRELWKSDGTAAGTVMVKDIKLTEDIYRVFGSHGISKSPGSSDPNNLTNVNGTLFFIATDGNGYELWKSDGTAAGTVSVVANVDYNSQLTAVNGTVFFNGPDGTYKSLWKSDGTAAGSTIVAPVAAEDETGDLANVSGTLFFKAGNQLWKSDGTTAGTGLVKDIYPGNNYVGSWQLTNVNGLLYFTANDGVHGWELWQSDGTDAGTVMQDINPGSASSSPNYLVAWNNKLYFSANDGIHGNELWDPPPVGGYTTGPLVQLSSTSLYANSTADNLPLQDILLNSEDENQVAVDPTNPNHFVVLWQGDVTTVGNRGQNVGVTFDGGKKWHVAPLPGVSQVSGGPLQSVADPWLAFAPNGDLYATTLAFTSPQQFVGATVEDNVLVLKSTDGGLTWSAPTVLHDNTDSRAFNDRESITADPTDPRFAYMTWHFESVPSGYLIRNEQPVLGFAGIKLPLLFTRTTDGGRTWEPVRTIYDPGADAGAQLGQIIVRPDGTLLDIFDEILVNKDNGGAGKFEVNLSILTSQDHGQTWSNGKPIRAAKMQALAVSDPDNGIPLDDTSVVLPHMDVAQDPHNGYLYAVWMDGRFSGGQYDSIAFSMSTDGGLTWSRPIKINQTPTNIPAGDQQAWQPLVKVAADGTVAVTYYDIRNNDASPGLPTDYWAVFGKPTTPTALTDPANWGNELRLTDKSFDLEKALFLGEGDPVPGLFTGDYVGLKAVGDDFIATFCIAGVSPTDPKSVFFRRLLAGAPAGAVSIGPSGELATPTPQPASGPALRPAASATGWGWLVAPTPGGDAALAAPADQGTPHASDLLAALADEAGPVRGDRPPPSDLMQQELAPGARPTAQPTGELGLLVWATKGPKKAPPWADGAGLV